MISLSTLTESDLESLKGKKVFIFGLRHCSFRLYKILRFYKIDVVGYSIHEKAFHPTLKRRMKEGMKGLRYIKTRDLKFILGDYNSRDIIVLPFAGSPEGVDEIKEHLKEFNLNFASLQTGEILASFSHVIVLPTLKSRLKFIRQKIRFKKTKVPKYIKKSWKSFCKNRNPFGVVICSPRKTADHTLNYTFNKHAKKNNFLENYAVNLWHTPACINRSYAEKKHDCFKIVMGVREPVSQNISSLYEDIGAGLSIETLFYNELFGASLNLPFRELIEKYENIFADGIDVQQCWNIHTSLYLNAIPKQPFHQGFIQDFILGFAKYVVDITTFPFDQEKGYTIIKDGDTEVFVYQLEKLNSLIPELSEWVGIPFDKLENGNQASEKWVAESYKQAQKEIEISQEYFDKCFDEPYVKHCYSEADIETFKEKWRSHIK